MKEPSHGALRASATWLIPIARYAGSVGALDPEQPVAQQNYRSFWPSCEVVAKTTRSAWNTESSQILNGLRSMNPDSLLLESTLSRASMDEFERDSLEAAFQAAFEQQQSATSEAESSAALTEFKRLAGLGHAAASANAGYMLANGIGAPTDHEEARRWLSLGAERGDATAINNLAVMFLMGSGVEADAYKACELFEVAANKGHVGAQLSLGELYESGEFLNEDLERAKHWFEAAAQQGDPTGMFRLGRLLSLAGVGSQSEGMKWLEAAAGTGNPEWQYLLAVHLDGEPELRGTFGPRHWYEKGCRARAQRGHCQVGGLRGARRRSVLACCNGSGADRPSD